MSNVAIILFYGDILTTLASYWSLFWIDDWRHYPRVGDCLVIWDTDSVLSMAKHCRTISELTVLGIRKMVVTDC